MPDTSLDETSGSGLEELEAGGAKSTAWIHRSPGLREVLPLEARDGGTGRQQLLARVFRSGRSPEVDARCVLHMRRPTHASASDLHPASAHLLERDRSPPHR